MKRWIKITFTLFFLTGNTHKFEEIKRFIETSGVRANIEQKNVPLVEIQTELIEKVAKVKLLNAKLSVKGNYFVEDAGFFIDQLNEFPGVFSSYVHKMIGNEGIIKLMQGVKKRTASFRSVIALMLEGELFTFHGRVNGAVATEIRGTQGFGYDPIFIPDGLDKTFAEIPMDQKNSMSHRVRALQAMCNYLLSRT